MTDTKRERELTERIREGYVRAHEAGGHARYGNVGGCPLCESTQDRLRLTEQMPTLDDRWNTMSVAEQAAYVHRLERAVLDMGREVGTLRQQHREALEAVASGRRWAEPYCARHAPLAEQITALANACAYWHTVAEGQSHG